MAIKDDITKFLRSNPYITRINFAFGAFKIYPGAYQKHVADVFASEEIKIRMEGAGSAGAAYDMNYDSLELKPSFDITITSDQGLLVHECTHAYLDMQKLGLHSGHENEGAGYLAEAVFLEAAGYPPIGSQPVRIASHRIAKTVLAGIYWIPAVDVAALTSEVAKEPDYATKVTYNSNGFERSLIHKILR
ncbi:MAG: hypothetical protein M3033_03630 [Acidobacteriota bacterium]|nr:hypothetical protein [Acidobacteriota bacterium]